MRANREAMDSASLVQTFLGMIVLLLGIFILLGVGFEPESLKEKIAFVVGFPAASGGLCVALIGLAGLSSHKPGVS